MDSRQPQAASALCIPLLKFGAGEDLPHLEEAGLSALSLLPPPVSIVTFLGDGRCGKSTLASRLAHGNRGIIFPIGDTGEPVTAGIDLCVVPSTSSSGTLVVLDCEGGNNPTGAIRSAVDLVAMLCSTLTVQVMWGQMGESQLLQIGQGLAARDRLLTGVGAGLPAQRLLLVVNGCHLRYAAGHLDKTFRQDHVGSESSRNELRAKIKRAYDQIMFSTVPHEMDPTFAKKMGEFEKVVKDSCSPVALAGRQLSGAQVVEILRQTVGELHSSGAVPVPSIFRHVIFHHLLVPLVNSLSAEVDASLPDLDDEVYRPQPLDCRPEILQRFEEDARHLTYPELVAEARESLRDRINRTWQAWAARNEAVGQQDRDVTTEFDTRYDHCEERTVGFKRSCLVVGKRRPVVQACNVFRTWTRTRVLKKNGQIVYSDWAPGQTMEPSESQSCSDLSTCSYHTPVRRWSQPAQISPLSSSPRQPASEDSSDCRRL